MDLTYHLSQGQNCLIHCAGGSGRTGMVVAAVVKVRYWDKLFSCTNRGKIDAFDLSNCSEPYKIQFHFKSLLNTQKIVQWVMYNQNSSCSNYKINTNEIGYAMWSELIRMTTKISQNVFYSLKNISVCFQTTIYLFFYIEPWFIWSHCTNQKSQKYLCWNIWSRTLFEKHANSYWHQNSTGQSNAGLGDCCWTLNRSFPYTWS